MPSRFRRLAGPVLVAMSVVVVAAPPALAASGGLDTSFSGNGKVLTDVSNGFDAAAGVAIQADDKVVAAGSSAGNAKIGIVRYDADGTLDHSFGGDGKVLTNLSKHDEAATAVAIQADGKIVVAGSIERFARDGRTVGKFLVVRYATDGTLDPAFGRGDGWVTTRFSKGGLDEAHALAIQGDGKIVIAGGALDRRGTRFAVARFDIDGTLDASFGADGRVRTRFRSGSEARGVAIAPSGAIVAAGGLVPERGRFDVVRYASDGTLDGSFSGDGKVSLDLGRGEESATGVVVQPDGRVVVAGYTDVPHEFGDRFFGRFALVRLAADGALDPSFGGDGVVRTRFGRQTAAAFAVALQANGRIVAVGSTRGDFALARYLPGGALDASFGGDGRVRTDFGTEAAAVAVAVRSGRIAAAGVADERFAVTRYLVS